MVSKKLNIDAYTVLFHAGGENLYAKVTVEIADELFHSELKKRGSEMFRNKTSWLQTQVSTDETLFRISLDMKIPTSLSPHLLFSLKMD